MSLNSLIIILVIAAPIINTVVLCWSDIQAAFGRHIDKQDW